MDRYRNDGAARLTRAAVVVAFGLMLVGCDLVKTSPPASKAPAPSAAAPSPSASSAISSAELAGHRYAVAVVQAFRSDPLVAHVLQSATVTTTLGGTTAKATVAMTLDVSGRDVKSAIVIKSGGKTTGADLVVVGKTAYARARGSGWKKAPRNGFEKDISDTIKGLRLIDDPADLRYVGLETIDQRDLHHLTAARTIPYTASNGIVGKYDTFDIWITEDGTPVLVKATYAAKSGSVTIKGTTQFRFFNFGGPIKIVAPKTK